MAERLRNAGGVPEVRDWNAEHLSERHVEIFDASVAGNAPSQREELQVLREMTREWSEAVHAELARVETDREGLRIAEVDAFFAELGLRRALSVELWVSHAKRIGEIYARHSFRDNRQPLGPEGPVVQGRYENLFDTALLFRDSNIEKFNGPDYSTSILVHELAHASGGPGIVGAVLKGDIWFPKSLRSGHNVHDIFDSENTHGEFLEEGFAEYIRGLFVERVLNRPFGFASDPSGSTTVEVSPDSEKLGRTARVPLKYVFLGPEGLRMGPSSYCATAIELLVARDPSLLDSLIEARSSVDGLRQVAAKIDSIEPGLYRELRDKFNGADGETNQEFFDGLLRVIEVLNRGNSMRIEPDNFRPSVRRGRGKSMMIKPDEFRNRGT